MLRGFECASRFSGCFEPIGASGALKFAARKGHDGFIFRNRNLAFWPDQCGFFVLFAQMTTNFRYATVLETYLNHIAMRLVGHTLCAYLAGR
jgi:hypothetical protein